MSKEKEQSVILFVAQFYKTSRITVVASIVLAIVQSTLLVGSSYLLKSIFDALADTGFTLSIVMQGTAVVALFVAGSALALFARWQILGKVKRHISHLRNKLSDSFLNSSRETWLQTPVDEVQLVIATETERQDDMLNTLFGAAIPAAIVSTGLLGALLYFSPTLFLFAVVLLVIMSALQATISGYLRSATVQFHRAYERFFNGITFIGGYIELIQTRSTMKKEQEAQVQKTDSLRQASMQIVKTTTLFRSLLENLVIIVIIVLIFVGSWLVATGEMSVGELTSAYLIIWLLRSQLGTLASGVPKIIAGKESLKKISAFRQQQTPMPISGDLKLAVRGELVLENVFFSYDNRTLLKGVNLRATPGKCTALLGGNGSGKTTLIHLVLGFYSPQKGRILMDDCPLKALDLVHLRRQIGLVQQHPVLIDASIRTNICYGSPDASEQQIQRAIQRAGLSDLIAELDTGVESRLGENGVRLSGGQRQAIALARALLCEPSMIILDEPTNHLDNESVNRLVGVLKSLPFAPTILLISHNKKVLEMADHAYLLSNGTTEKVK